MVLFLVLGQAVFAQESQQSSAKMAAGLAPEFNMNSADGAAGGLGLGFDYNLPIGAAKLAAGVFVTASSDFDSAFVLEAAGTFRWYFLDFDGGANFPAKTHTGFFAQADLGVHMILADDRLDDDEILARFLGGLRVGCRLPLGNMFYIEPYARGGFPFAFGIGLTAGIMF